MEAVGGIALKSVWMLLRKLLRAIKSGSKNGISDLVDNEGNFNAQYQAKIVERSDLVLPAVVQKCHIQVYKLGWFGTWCQKNI